MKQCAYNVYLNGKEIDTVFFNTYSNGTPIPSKDVYESLVEHDGYNPNIKIFMETTGKDQKPKLI